MAHPRGREPLTEHGEASGCSGRQPPGAALSGIQACLSSSPRHNENAHAFGVLQKTEEKDL